MIVADAERHPEEPGWRWLLVDLDTGERKLTGQLAYSTPEHATDVGERQLACLPPIDDATEVP